ncbi:MAG: hypothetical protein ACJ8AG_01560 [Ktedonobacteraceae bacterium]
MAADWVRVCRAANQLREGKYSSTLITSGNNEEVGIIRDTYFLIITTIRHVTHQV